MITKNLYCLIGPSGSGKTFLADILGNSVPSYTTRPKRFDTETGHIFVTDDEYNRIPDENKVAENRYNGHRYCATIQQLNAASCYVIDVPGYKMLMEKKKEAALKSDGVMFTPINSDGVAFEVSKAVFTPSAAFAARKIIPIFIFADERVRFKRCIKRAPDKKATIERFKYDEATWPGAISELYMLCDGDMHVFENNTNHDKIQTTLNFLNYIRHFEKEDDNDKFKTGF